MVDHNDVNASIALQIHVLLAENASAGVFVLQTSPNTSREGFAGLFVGFQIKLVYTLIAQILIQIVDTALIENNCSQHTESCARVQVVLDIALDAVEGTVDERRLLVERNAVADWVDGRTHCLRGKVEGLERQKLLVQLTFVACELSSVKERISVESIDALNVVWQLHAIVLVGLLHQSVPRLTFQAIISIFVGVGHTIGHLSNFALLLRQVVSFAAFQTNCSGTVDGCFIHGTKVYVSLDAFGVDQDIAGFADQTLSVLILGHFALGYILHALGEGRVQGSGRITFLAKELVGSVDGVLETKLDEGGGGGGELVEVVQKVFAVDTLE